MVCINVYLPHSNYKEPELYDTLIGEIIGHIETLGDQYAYILAGDFNTSGRNVKSFNRLVETLNLSNWSSNIPVTYAQNTQGGICSSKLDHFLAKNITQSATCQTNTNKLVKGGHYLIEARVPLIHLEIEDSPKFPDIDREKPIRIDYEKINESEAKTFLRDSNRIIEEAMLKLKPSLR